MDMKMDGWGACKRIMPQQWAEVCFEVEDKQQASEEEEQ